MLVRLNIIIYSYLRAAPTSHNHLRFINYFRIYTTDACPHFLTIQDKYLLMRKQYYLVCALLLLFGRLAAQPCDFTQADLIAAPGPGFTIPAGQTMCITANTCMGAASNFPGACANSNINSITVNGTLVIKENITFNFAGSIVGTGVILILDRARISIFGSINCSNGMSIEAVDRTIVPPATSSTLPMPSCSAPACQPTYSDGYSPFGIVTPGLGYTSTGCSVHGFPSTSILLPVTFQDFRGLAEGNGIRLNWKTASEQNNRGFEVQRINTNNVWETAGMVNSKAPEGNSAITLDYSFLDNSPVASASRSYRLKQIDLNGHSSYSTIIRVDALKANEWRVSTAGSNINIQVQSASSENAMISIVSAAGNTVYRSAHTLNAGSNLIVIPAASYAKGLHVVTLQLKGGEMRREKVLLR